MTSAMNRFEPAVLSNAVPSDAMLSNAGSACSIKPNIKTKANTVSVNGVVILRADIALETQNHPASTPTEAWKAASRALVIRELLLQEATRLDIRAEPLTDELARRETPDEARIRAVIDQEVFVPAADEASCRRYYDQNLPRFRSPDLFEVSHILFAAASDDNSAFKNARNDAEKLITALELEPGLFAEYARQYSVCPSGELGGNLGQIGPGQTVPEFERALPCMQVGKVHDQPVQTRYGFHVVRVNRHEPGRQLPFDLVASRIGFYLEDRVRHTAFSQYICLLASTATISGIELVASRSALGS